ncbi:MAG: alpha/beta hydrolase [Ruminococcaceae bacterium]|nr:alpha/beta hydrolase [Oscillospiraceae bacterium]
MFWFFLILIILLVFLGVLFYFFALAFIKQNMGDVDDMDSPVNKPLEEFKETIQNGIDVVNSKPHKWIYTTSFDGLKLAARYYDNNSKKTIILVHGYRSSAARDFSCAVSMYLNFGFNVLLIDQRSHGRSEGKLITFGVKESYDAVSWANLMVSKFGAEEIAFSGLSMGATTVVLACKRGLPSQVKCVIADCGFTSPVDIIKKVAKDSFKINANFFIPFLNVFCLLFGKFSLYKDNTVEVVKKCTMPILFIHGKCDNFVPCEMSQKAYENACDKCKILTVEGASHGLSFLVDTENVKQTVGDFLNTYTS